MHRRVRPQNVSAITTLSEKPATGKFDTDIWVVRHASSDVALR